MLKIRGKRLISQALSKLSILVKDSIQAANIDIITEKVDNLDCVQHLWDSCSHRSVFVSSGATNIWLQFVVNGLADFSYVINGFVSRIISSNFEVSVNLSKSLKELLMLQLEFNGQHVYQLRSSVHPFIIILQQKGELWTIVFEQIKSILYHQKFDLAYASLITVLKYILWKYLPTHSLSGLRLALINELWDRVHASNHPQLKHFVWSTLFWLKDDCSTSAVESQLELCHWSKLYLHSSMSGEQDWRSSEDLLLCVVSFAKKLNDFQMDLSGCAHYIHMLASNVANQPATPTSETIIVVLSQLLSAVPEDLYPIICQSCELLSSRDGTTSLVIGLLFVNAVISVNICGQSKNYAFGANRVNRTPVVLSLLNKLEQRLHSMNLTERTNFFRDRCELYDAENFNEVSLRAFQITRFCRRLSNATDEILLWLDWIDQIMNSDSGKISDSILHLVCSHIYQPVSDFKMINRCIDILLKIARRDPDKAPSIFVLIIYKLKIEKDPKTRVLICQMIPRLATSKVCIGPILKTLLAFHKDPPMEAMAIRLIKTLWLQQERIYPVLYKLLVEESLKSPIGVDKIDDVSLAKAASILDVCRIKPHLYGSDLLTALSKLVVNNWSDVSTPISVLALESILLLCREDVIDLKTTWKFLFPSLNEDKRLPVQIKMCELLSLTAETGLDESDPFVDECVCMLWKNGLKSDPEVAAFAFKYLSKFKRNQHKLEYFPQEVTSRVKLPQKLKSEIEAKSDSVEVEEEINDVPGSCYVDLLPMLPASVITSYGEVMCSVVNQEVRDMPRSLLNMSRSASTLSSQSKDVTIKSVSKLLIEKYDSPKSSNLEGSLALGLLFAFDPQTDVPKEGRWNRHLVISHGRLYSAKLEQFLLKVSLDAGDWRKCLIYSSAWSSFMERLYYAMVEARELQIDIQQAQDGIAKVDLLKSEASLWTRDRILETIKNVARVNPSAHGNAMIALAGLCQAVYKHNLLTGNNHREGSEYMSHGSWMQEVAVVICKCLEPQTDLISGVFSWCHPGSGAMSETVRTYTALAVPLISYILINSDQHLTEKLLTSLQNGLDSGHQFMTRNFCYGLSLGQLLFNLQTEHSCDSYAIANGARKFSQYCFQDDDWESRRGGILGLGIVAAAFCHEPTEDSNSFVNSVLTHLKSRLNKELPSSLLYEILLTSLVIVMTSAGSAHIISREELEELFESWHSRPSNMINNRSDAIAFGLLLEYLASTDAKFVAIKSTWLKKWADLLREDEKTLTKLAALHGLFSISNGCFESSYIFKTCHSKSKGTDIFINLLRSCASGVTEFTVQDCCFWMLGCSYWKLSHTIGAINEGPPDYSFLDHRSVLKSTVKYLQDLINAGINRGEHEAAISACLKCLGLQTPQPYPDLNWPLLLNPLLYQSEEIQMLCIEVALARATRSLSAKTFLTSLLDAKLFSGLSENNKIWLLGQLKQIVKIINANRLQIFLRRCISKGFQSTSQEKMGTQLLKALHEAVLVPDLTPDVLRVLNLTLGEILHCITPDMKGLWSHYCEVSMRLPEEILDEIVSGLDKDVDHVVKITKFRCEIVGRGKFPLHWLNSWIESSSLLEFDKKKLWDIHKSFLLCFQSVARHCSETSRINWIFELMGHIKDLAQSETHCVNEPIEKSKIVTNLFNIFACAILSWTDLNVRALHIITQDGTEDGEFIIDNLPIAFQNLLNQSSWKSQNRKVIEWLLFLHQCTWTEKTLRSCIKECLFDLRHCDEFQRSSLWVRLLEVVET